MAVLIPPVQDAYEVYWNGRKIGASGKLPPHGWWVAVPAGRCLWAEAGASGWRAGAAGWKAPLASDERLWGGGLRAAPLIGSLAVLTMRPRLAQMKAEDIMLPRFVFAGALAVTGIIALLLYLRERSNLVYLGSDCCWLPTSCGACRG